MVQEEPLSASLMNDDPLYGGVYMMEDEIKLENGRKILTELREHVAESEPVDGVLHASDDVLKTFAAIFPEIVDSNDVTRLTKESFREWRPGQNELVIAPDPDPKSYDALQAKDVYVGGPAAAIAATIQATGKESKNVTYINYGSRGASNWKGAASYFHVRDAIPVYYWPDNHGAYTLYATAKHWFEQKFCNEKYLNDVATNPNWNKLRLSLRGLIDQPSVFGLFAKNQWYALGDVGLHMEGTRLKKVQDTTAYATTDHAYISKDIAAKLDTPKPIVMTSRPGARALHLHLGGQEDLEETNGVFRHLREVAGDLVRSKKMTDEEIRERGYETPFVTQSLEFPQDGYIPPYVDSMLDEIIAKNGGETLRSAKLRKILVTPIENNDCRVSRIVLEDDSGEEHTLSVKSLSISLGPSMRTLRVEDEHGNTVANNMMQTMMHASGLSNVLMVKVDPEKVSPAHLTKFRDHVDAHNKHIVRLMEKTVISNDKPYHVFALQATGGGHFPATHAHAETGLNVLEANVIPLLGLDKTDGVEFDVIHSRSCARGITAQNCFRLAAPASNMSMIYGIGGIGMTTMGANGLMLQALSQVRKDLAEGVLTEAQYAQKMRTSDFTKIPHWKHANPFKQNYSKFLDYPTDPKFVARRLFRPNPLSRIARTTVQALKFAL